jgi:hypothetical protein
VNAERLASYLAGELDADQSAALEAALVGDARLRAELEAMRRADAALEALPRTELPDGFEARLRSAVDDELARVLRPEGGPESARRTTREPTSAGGAGTDRRGAGDELAARRARPARRSWVPAFAGAAAAVAVIAGAVVGVGMLGGDDTGDDAADTAMTLESFDDAGDADGAESALPPPGAGPTVIAGDRDLDDDLADELLASDELQAVTDQALDADAGRSLGATWRDALAALTPSEDASSSDRQATAEGEAAQDDATDEDAPRAESETGPGDELGAAPADAPVRLFADGFDGADLGAADRCLDEVLTGGTDAIPAYLELAAYDGEPAVVVGLVTYDPTTDAYTRPEVWILSREDCQLLRFSQE